jgi:RHS repeat-associated protein
MILNNKKRTGIALLTIVGIFAFIFHSQRQPEHVNLVTTLGAQVKPKVEAKLYIKQNGNVRRNVTSAKNSNQLKYKKIAIPIIQQPNQPTKLTAYLASPHTGIIGVYDGKQFDNPADNIFSVRLDYLPTVNDKVWLNYNLTGLDDNSNVVCSVNDRQSFGGYLAKKDTKTKRQRVQINSEWLQKGENRIQFGLPENVDYGYRISDLAIEVERGTSESPLAVNAGYSLYNSKAYIHGFIQELSCNTATVTIDGKAVSVRNGEFETIVVANDKLETEIQALIKGKLYSKTIRFKQNTESDKEFALQSSIPTTAKTFVKGYANALQTSEAQLKVGDKALLATKKMSLTTLRNIDLPALDMGMTNVTQQSKGFRFLPHGEHFTNGATVALKYDRSKIPNGYTENDIKTFYFDINSKHWVALERDTIDKALCMVVSKTTHFTDMINGVIKTPESPETQGFAPTIMNNIKAADPTSKIELIAPPSANNTGSADLSYSLELPPARNGISPNLGIQYNSDAGSGWLGEGWDLNVPSIKVDTRWGVPRYDPLYETETYSMGGTMLASVVKDTLNSDSLGNVSVGHRGILYNRNNNSDKQFHFTTESGFTKILRKTMSFGPAGPGNYYWEITDKNGVKYTYGQTGSSYLTGCVKSFKYASDSTKVFDDYCKDVITEWKLSRVENQYGDYCQYIYNSVPEEVKNGCMANANYLCKIKIGRIGATDGNDSVYQTIEFVSKSLKTKRTNNARYGFLTSSNQLLDSVIIKENNEKIRSYSFNYKSGAFGATLLDRLSKNDSANNLVGTHTFDYYNNITNTSNIFSDNTDVIDVKESVSSLPALGGGTTTTHGGSIYAGLGVGIGSVGAEIGYARSSAGTESDKKMMVIDINGDGLPDKVYKKANNVYFRPNLGLSTFGNETRIDGLPSKLTYSETKSTGNTIQGEVEIGKSLTASCGVEWNTTYSKVPIYFSDVNNDGLVDVVNNGIVYFNTTRLIDGVGVPSFSTSSQYTLNPIKNIKTTIGKAGEIASQGALVRDTAFVNIEKREMYEAAPMQDIVRVWEAPYTGNITINNTYKRLACANDNVDDLRLSIQIDNTEPWSILVNPTDTAVEHHNLINSQYISAGQKIYFRLQSGTNEFSTGDGDIVKWNPVITYNNLSNIPADVNGYSNLEYKISDGSIINKIGYNQIDSGVPTLLKGTFVKPQTTDSVFLKVYLSNDSILYKDSIVQNDTSTIKYRVESKNPNYYYKRCIKTFPFGIAATTSNVEFQLSYLPGANQYWFEICSKSNIRWEQVKWKPELHYKYQGIDTVLYAGVKYNAFSKKLADGNVFSYYYGGWLDGTDITFTPQISLNTTKKINASLTLVVYDVSGNKELRRVNGSIKNSVVSIGKFKQNWGNSNLYTVLYVNDTADFKITAKINCDRVGVDDTSYPVAICRLRSTKELDLGPMWRGWGLFQYNADNGRYRKLIDQSQLVLPTDTAHMKLSKMAIFNMNPDFITKTYWKGLNENMFIMGDTMSCGRLNVETMPNLVQWGSAASRVKRVPADAQFDLTQMSLIGNTVNSNIYFDNSQHVNENPSPSYEVKDAPTLSATYKSTTYWGATNALSRIGIKNVSGSSSTGNGHTTMAFTDMNGDGYPDRITDNKIEFSSPRGGRDSEITNIESDATESNAWSVGFGSGSGRSNSTTKYTGVRISGNTATISASQLSKDINATAGVSHYTNNESSSNTYIDVNGDGLPDRVYKDINDNNKIKVRYNLGYSFSDQAIDWGMEYIQKSKTEGISISAAINAAAMGTTTQEAISVLNDTRQVTKGFKFALNVGVGINGSLSTSRTLYTLKDINGDGLVDKVYQKSNNKYCVEYNLGNSFSTPVDLDNFNGIQCTEATAISGNIDAKLKVRILFIRISLGGGVNGGITSDYMLNDMQDIDGDGYPDMLAASGNTKDKLNVRHSLIGCTDKLKSVTNPLGGTFTLEYRHTKATSNHPGGKWVMNALTVDDGVADDGKSIKNKFEYDGGKYDRHEHEFLGFATVTTNNINSESTTSDDIYRSLTQVYDTCNYYCKGNLLSSKVSDGVGKLYNKNTNEYYTYSVTRITKAGTTKGAFCMKPTILTTRATILNQFIVYNPLKYTKDQRIEYNNGSQTTLTTSEAYMEYATASGKHGEMTLYKFSDKGTLGSSGAGSYNYKTELEYTDRITEVAYVFGLPIKATVKGNDGKIYRQVLASWNTWYPNQLTRVKNVIAVGDTAITDMSYDYWGNIKQKLLPANKAGQRMSYSYQYDPIYHMYPTQITDAFGYTSNMENYDYRYGIPRKTTDINGNVMTTEIDNLGRVKKIKGPNESDYTLKFEYYPLSKDVQGKNSAYAITKHYDPANPTNDLETYTFVDGFGRAIQVKKDGVIDGQEKMIVSGRAKYDAFGRVIEAFYPVVDELAKTVFNPAFGDNIIPPTKNTYDVLDRVTETVLPDSSTTKMSYSIEGGTLKTTVTDALNHSQETYTNGSGQTVKTQQHLGNETINTLFEYDPINQLTVVTDAKSGQTKSEYDMAGRRTQVTHPASGVTKFKYNAAGNLIEKQTANLDKTGVPIKYQYDFNRLKEINYPNHPENDVKYVYGTKDEAGEQNAYRAGRLKYQEDGSGGQEFKYGKMGELTEVRRTMVIPNQAVATYVTGWKYDCWNRVQTMTYPDGEVLNYAYNTAGLLTGVTGTKGGYTYPYVKNIGYDKFEQRATMQYGNGANGDGTITTYTYNPLNRQLSNLQVLADNNAIMNNAYTYDAVSNVKAVTNTGTSTNGIGGGMVHNYTYDDLYRLQSANGTFTGANGKTASYTLGMGYDNLHNIIRKNQTMEQTGVQFDGLLKAGYNLSYQYADNHQQISNIADSSYRYADGESHEPILKTQQYSYDANGNMLCINTGTKTTDGKLQATNSRKMLWDEENRLLALSDNGFVSNYWYDAAGERTVKTSGDVEGIYLNGLLSGARTGTSNFTAYVSPYTVVGNGGQMSKHIYMGSQRIVSKLCNSGTMADPTADSKAGAKDFTAKYALQTGNIKVRYDSLGVTYRGKDNAGVGFYTAANSTAKETLQYFYHSDHLGSSSLITDIDGNVAQHIEYIPFGEVFVEERNNSWKTPYKFNGKELDEETGLYYYGARYMDPRTSVWLSMDPLAEKFPRIGSYVFCMDNPVGHVDLDGKEPTPAQAARMSAHVYGDKVKLTGGWHVSKRDFGLNKTDLNNSNTGLKSQVYERTIKGKTEYTYATAGTEQSWKDVGADVKQPLGLSKQYEKAAENAKIISNILGKTELTYTGHSLGGGEAALNALITDRKAITFNAAGVSEITKFAEGTWKTPFKSESKINAYVMTTDPLNYLQNRSTIMPDVNGIIHLLQPTDNSSIHNGHSITNILKNFKGKE